MCRSLLPGGGGGSAPGGVWCRGDGGVPGPGGGGGVPGPGGSGVPGRGVCLSALWDTTTPPGPGTPPLPPCEQNDKQV